MGVSFWTGIKPVVAERTRQSKVNNGDQNIRDSQPQSNACLGCNLVKLKIKTKNRIFGEDWNFSRNLVKIDGDRLKTAETNKEQKKTGDK